MKNFIALILIGSILISCQFGDSTTTQTPPPVPSPPEVPALVIGYDVSDEGEKRTLVAGSMTNVEVWEKYIKAHNERDLEAIMGMNSDNFTARGPRGEYIEGSEAHKEFLTQWFEENSPKWTSKYFIANDLTTKEGELRQWVTSGHDLTLNVEGKEVIVFQIHDALIADGKVQTFSVHERVKGENE
ncbi:MAG: hypothetical protein P8L83_02220 [Flavobacteriaceae bacterium]|nr:hypothetical protein [Flavobacteriaceae bacterium]